MTGFRGAVSFECRVVRIEAFTRQVVEREQTSQWEVTAIRSPASLEGRGIGVMYGHLVTQTKEVWGQVLVLGTISRDTPFPSFSAFKRFMRVHGVGMVEELYDVGRRALNVNAALMDLDFGVEVTSPEVPMDFVDALQETVVEQDPLPVTE